MKTKNFNPVSSSKLMAAAGLLLSASLFLTACGSGSSSSDSLSAAAKKYVKLGDYKGIEVTVDKTADADPTDDELNTYIDDTLIKNTAPYMADPSKSVIGEDDIVNVDYMGLLDGNPFDGGTASDVNLDIKNNCDPVSQSGYIDGFTSGLVGHSVGETVDCPVTFPTNYQATDLAGKDVVFRFTVNFIGMAATHENLTDDYVKTNFGKDTVADFLDYAKEQYKNDASDDYDSELKSAVTSAVVNNAEVGDVPDSLIDSETSRYIKAFMLSNSLSSDSDLESFLSSNYNMSLSDFESTVKQSQSENIEKELIFMAIAEKEGIEAKGDDYNSYVSNIMMNNGYSSEDEIYQKYMPKDMLQDYYRINAAIDFCTKNAKAD